MVRSTHRIPRPKRPHDVRRFANAAQADVASVASNLALLIEAYPSVTIEPDTQRLIQAGIKSKCLTAIANLQIIVAMMGGDQ